MKIRIITACLVFVAMLSSAGQSQTNIFLDLQLTNQGAQVFLVGDFDFVNSGLSVDYFFIQLDNVSPSSSPTCRFRLVMDVILNNGSVTEIIGRGETDPFDLPPGSTNILTSSQLAAGTAMVAGQPIRINYSNSNVDFDAVEDLESQVLTTGKLPTGIYAFELKLLSEGPPVAGCPSEIADQVEDNHTMVITNPTTLELLFPGRSISESGVSEITTTFPYFQWFSDASPVNTMYNIFVFEKYPDDQSVQDVLSHPAILHIENYSLTFFQYPTEPNPTLISGDLIGPVRLLEAGKIYYWFIQAVIPSGTGQVTLTADPFRFKVSDLSQSVNFAPQILAFLRQALGPNYEPTLQQLVEEGFEPNGNILYDGTNMEVNDLFQMLNQILQGDLQLQGVEVY